MIKVKTIAPNNILVSQDLKLYDIINSYDNNENNNFNLDNTSIKYTDKHIITKSNDEYYFEDMNRCCPHCYSKKVIKNRNNTRKLQILNKGILKVHVKVYYCSNCGKYYQTDLTDFISENSNITDDIREIILDLYRIFNGSLRKRGYSKSGW